MLVVYYLRLACIARCFVVLACLLPLLLVLARWIANRGGVGLLLSLSLSLSLKVPIHFRLQVRVTAHHF